MPTTAPASFSAQFTTTDWLVVIGYLALTTWLGARLAGKQATIRDFFLGGRKLPWYAVSGSIIATEISALTFVSVPFVVFRPGGDFTYLQLGVFGSLFARLIVGYVLVPAYYQREIYSPYDYMGNQLGGHTRSMTTALFALGGMLGQSARVYLTAEVLVVVLHDQLMWLSSQFGLNPLGWAIVLIAIIAITWTMIGGISTVIWTDVILFLVFLLGAGVALGTVVYHLDGGFAELLRIGWQARTTDAWYDWGKFTFFDFSISPLRTYTIWTAVIASTWGGLGPYGTDQLLAQRMFCCKGPREARWAIISSAAGQIVTLTVMFVGAGLYAYYRQHPLSDTAQAIYDVKGDRIFPIFIVEVIPIGLKGLIIAGIFAAAVSSLTSILAALSQTVMTAFYTPLRMRRMQRSGRSPDANEDRHSVFVGRLMVLFWGVVLSLMAGVAAIVADYYKSILDLGLAMAGYVHGALLAGFLLAFLPLRIDSRGFMYSGPLSVMCVFALVWHQPWAHAVCWSFALVLLGTWLAHTRSIPGALVLVGGLALMLGLNYAAFDTQIKDGELVYRTIAWPWYTPIGSTVAFVWGYLLARRREPSPAMEESVA